MHASNNCMLPIVLMFEGTFGDLFYRSNHTVSLPWQLPYTVVYVIVIAREPGIYGSKPTVSEGVARGQGWFTLP